MTLLERRGREAVLVLPDEADPRVRLHLVKHIGGEPVVAVFLRYGSAGLLEGGEEDEGDEVYESENPEYVENGSLGPDRGRVDIFSIMLIFSLLKNNFGRY